MADDHALLRGWVELARRSYAIHPEYQGGEAALGKHRRAVADFICRGRIAGEVRALWAGERLRAAVSCYPEVDSWFGQPRRTIVFNRDPGDDDAGRWLVAQVADLGVDPHTDIIALASDRSLVDPLLAACPTLGVDSVILLGQPRIALDALVAARDPAPYEAHGLSVGPVADMAEVEALVKLSRDVFSAHPEWCWFCDGARQLSREMAGLMLALDGEPDDLTEVIRADGEPVGMAQVHLEDNPLWGRCAGFGLLLHPRLWGRGIVKSMYRRMLERLVQSGALMFKGGTSQPPVMHLGRLMKRPLHGIHLRAGAPLPRDHFAPYLGRPGD